MGVSPRRIQLIGVLILWCLCPGRAWILADAVPGVRIPGVQWELRATGLWVGQWGTLDPTALEKSLSILKSGLASSPVRLRSIRELAGRHEPAVVTALQSVVRDSTRPAAERAEAVVSLTGMHEDHLSSLVDVLAGAPEEVQLEMVRGLRSWNRITGVRKSLESLASGQGRIAGGARWALGRPESRPDSVEAWQGWIAGSRGDIESGRRLFHSPISGCGQCHRIEGRGGHLGPDLSAIARGSDRKRLLQSLVNPSREVDPKFAQVSIEILDGEVLQGRLWEDDTSSVVTLIQGAGTLYRISPSQIRERRLISDSLMPEGLLDGMSLDDVRDLMAFLESRQ